MSEKECLENQSMWITILNYISRFIIPILLVPICGGILYSNAAINSNTKDVGYVKKEIERVSTEHNSRIMTNQIGIEKTVDRVSKLEVYLPQILDYMKDNKSENKDNRKHQREIIKSISNLEKTVAVLIDRDKRNKEENK